ncbi:adenylyltransferase/cytidyltransferase family protein [Streptomyces sp. NPDC051320]|uniref:adenylyltransferase/cytidyltransferase family protein n=1 Tax=Streptomyces sp. NPDC051320 TaxID=3154644 RepID=UPI003417510B
MTTSRRHRVGYAPGAYDLFHIGHLNILRHARSQCDYLVAGVVSDEMAERAKGRRPMIPLVERLEIVRSVKYVDAAFVETVPDKVETWKQVRFDVLFKGDDWRGTSKGEKLEQDFAVVGVEIVYFPYTVHTSSTQLRRALDVLAEPEASFSQAAFGPEQQFNAGLRSIPGTTS